MKSSTPVWVQILIGVAATVVGFLLAKIYDAWAARSNRGRLRRETAHQLEIAAHACQEFQTALSNARQGEVTRAPNFPSDVAGLRERFLERDPRLTTLSNLISQCSDHQRQKRLLDARELLLSGLGRCAQAEVIPVEEVRKQAVLEGYANTYQALAALDQELMGYAQSLQPPKRTPKPRIGPPSRWQRFRRFVHFLPRWYREVTDSPTPPTLYRE